MSARGGFASRRETISTGRVFAAIPRSASQISPGLGLIEKIQNFLLDGPRPHQVQGIVVSEAHDFGDQGSHLVGSYRVPLSEFRVESFGDRIHFDGHPTSLQADGQCRGAPNNRVEQNRRRAPLFWSYGEHSNGYGACVSSLSAVVAHPKRSIREIDATWVFV
jgi:hypothetical protein